MNDFHENNANENILIRTIHEVANDQAGAEDLSSALEKTRESLKAERKRFDRTVSGQPIHVQNACKSSILNVNRYFEEYFKILDEISNYIRTFDKTILDSAPESLTKITARLDRGFFDFRQHGLTALGPTKVPGVNLLINTIAGRMQNAPGYDKNRLADQVAREGTVVEETLAQLENRAPAPQTEGLQKAYAVYLESLDILMEYSDTGDNSLLPKAVEGLLNAGKAIEESGRSASLEEFSRGPTTSPPINAVINTAAGVRNGDVNVEIFSGAVNELWEVLQDLRFKFNAITRAPAQSRSVEEEAIFLADSLEEMEDITNALFDFIDIRDVHLLNEAIERLEAMAADLETTRRIFANMSETEGKIACPRCGRYNRPGTKKCAKCNALLPLIAGTETSRVNLFAGAEVSTASRPETVMTTNVQKLFKAADDVVTGVVSTEEFIQTIAWMEEMLDSAYKAAGSSPPKPGQSADNIADIADTYIQGLEDFEVGLSFMKQYAVNPTVNGIEAGKQMVWQGLGKLQKVQEQTKHTMQKK